MRKKTLLLTNDDGFNSFGIKCLFEKLKKEYEIIIVAPDDDKSGASHSFTYNNPLFYEKISGFYAENMYHVKGSPADCVKFAVSHLLPEIPDIIVSGLNIGENSGISAFYSGTVAAAREGAFWKILSFAFSICNKAEKYSDHYVQLVPMLINEILNVRVHFGDQIFFNVNFPSCHPDEARGYKITRQSMAFFNDKYEQIIINGNSLTNGYRIYGEKSGIELSDDYDSRALLDNWITITPHSFDSTAYKEMNKIKFIENKLLIRGV